MGTITRDAASAAGESYDLIIVGGGVYGISLALEATRRNLKALLLEKDDFGGATSTNSLRIIHGGLRYLQSLDLPRFRESVAERRWFLSRFPGLIRPLPCLMPLYGDGLRRPSIFRVALFLNDILQRLPWDAPSQSEGALPYGGVIDAESVRRIYPAVDRNGLEGGAVWYDAIMPDPQRILVTILRKACSAGTTALNYVEARELLKDGKGVAGIAAVDRESGESFEFRSRIVVNATGPWSEDLADRFGSRRPGMFRRSVAWNVLLDREKASDHALAVKPNVPGGQTLFVVPWKGKILAGTGHAPYSGDGEAAAPSEEQLASFLDELNLSMPGLEATPSDVLHVYSGFLPVTQPGGTTLTKREVIFDHGGNGGPGGFYSVAGIKFTTARKVADKTLSLICDKNRFGSGVLPNPKLGEIFEDESARKEDSSRMDTLRRIIAEESVVHLDDLMVRRTDLGDDPARAMGMSREICGLFPWDEERSRLEIERLRKVFRSRGG